MRGLVLLALLASLDAEAADIRVGTTFGDYATVTEAVAAASAGDRLLLERGTFSESITVSIDLEIHAIEPYRVFLEGDASGPVIAVDSGATVQMYGMSLHGPGAERVLSVAVGSTLRLDDTYGNGGSQWGTYGDGAVGYVEGTLILHNSQLDGGGRATRGGVLFAAPNSTVRLTNSSLRAGSATDLGGCLYAEEALVELENTSLDACSVTRSDAFVDETAGGAFVAMSGGVLKVRDSQIQDTIGTVAALDRRSDVGLLLFGGSYEISRSRLTDMSLAHMSGDLLWIESLANRSLLIQSSGVTGEMIRGRICESIMTWEAPYVRNTQFQASALTGSVGTDWTFSHFEDTSLNSTGNLTRVMEPVVTGATLDGLGVAYGGLFPSLPWGTLDAVQPGEGSSSWTVPTCAEVGSPVYDYYFLDLVSNGGHVAGHSGLLPGIDLDGSTPDLGPLGGAYADPELVEDADGDGWGAHVDCDDTNPDVHPLANELCNGFDDDCDPSTVDGVAQTWRPDSDGDGFPTFETVTGVSCTEIVGSSTVPINDCADGDPTRNPGAAEVCDGVDNNCDGVIDPRPTTTWYPDIDGDGYGAKTGAVVQCGQPANYVANSGDCEDSVFGHGRVRVSRDFDGDGQGDVTGPQIEVCQPPAGWGPATDCDDTRTDAGLGFAEICNGLDDSCDGAIDEGLTLVMLFDDADGDGAGTGTGFLGCDGGLGTGFASVAVDCDESRMDVYPGAPELCDNIDNDCDGTADEGLAFEHWLDQDGDGYTDPQSVTACPTYAYETAPSALADCDDRDRFISPAAHDDDCDGVDEDCDGIKDDDPSPIGTFKLYPDLDGDGYGAGDFQLYCVEAIPGLSTAVNDCDDTDASVNIAATEVCDLVDNNCDGQQNEGLAVSVYYDDVDGDGLGGAAVTWCEAGPGQVLVPGDCHDGDANVGGVTSWYRDADGDGYGSASSELLSCNAGEGYLQVDGDCDDTDAAVSPLGTETCDGQDEDCDLAVDEGLTGSVFFEDLDGDGYGAAAVVACAPGGSVVAVGGDCDDDSATTYPDATEVCGDGNDQDCDGSDLVCNPTDSDGDGFCGGNCTDGSRPGDCNDADPAINPWATELCDGIDGDCDGWVDEHLTADADGDGFTRVDSCEGSADDCNDWIEGVFPGATEACNGLDDDCDGLVDEGVLIDADGDGVPAPGCWLLGVPPDCDDSNAAVFPGNEEVANNSLDDDCDGTQDEDPTADDDDGDGYCEGPVCTGIGVLPGDCDDQDPAVNPGPAAVEVLDGIDNDCDGNIDDGATIELDRDGDGYTLAQGDCNDLDESVHPGALERCNGFDDDCDGYVPAAEIDADGDQLSPCQGDCDDTRSNVRPGLAEDCSDGLDNNCSGEADEDSDHDADGYTTCNGDCIDLDALVNPGADEESCNQLDDDCDGTVDEGLDADQDGIIACTVSQLEGGCVPDLVVCDCDDNNKLVAPGLSEICGDGLDNDCDGAIDNDEDLDGDGWRTCQGDCDDGNPFVSPGTPETCDGRDNDCDRSIDETYDMDEDGWLTCRGDCDDASTEVYPFGEELCDLADNDCNTVIDDPWPDLDEDGITECDPVPDCDPTDANIGPEIAEDCGDGIDNDCDGDVDWQDSDCLADAFPSYCGCSSTGSPMSVLWLLPLVVVRRRMTGAMGVRS